MLIIQNLIFLLLQYPSSKSVPWC